MLMFYELEATFLYLDQWLNQWSDVGILCVFVPSDRDFGPDFSAAPAKPVIAGPQQQDQLHR